MDNPLTKFFTNMGLFGSNSNENAVGIDIGTSSIKVVEIKKKGGKATLETYGAIDLGSYGDTDAGHVTNLPPEKIAEALKEVLKQSSVTTKAAALSISIQSSLIFTVEIPSSVTGGDVQAVVATEARKYIPVPITEVSLDYFILPKKEASFEELNNPEMKKDSSQKNEVLVIAIQNEAISKYRTLVSECGLDAGFFEIEIFSSLRSNLEHELSAVLLVDFGASRTKLSIVEFGMIKSYHSINRGGADITESISRSLSIPFSKAEDMKREFGLFGNPDQKNLSETIKTHLDYIFSETNNVLLSYEKKYNQTISKVIFTGGGSLMKGIKEIAENNFKAEIEIGRPFSKVGAPAFLDKVLEATGPEFGVALGLALRKLQ